MSNTTRRLVPTALALAALAGTAHAQYIDWVDLTATDDQALTISGHFPGHPGLTLSYSGGYGFTYLNSEGAADNWAVFEGYISNTVRNPPRSYDLIAFGTESLETHTFTFSQAVTNPVVAFVSVGAGGQEIGYWFNREGTLLSNGAGNFGSGTLVVEPQGAPIGGSLVRGEEGHGTVQFLGTFQTLSFTVIGTEWWSGLTVGVPITGAQANVPPCPPSVASVSEPVFSPGCQYSTLSVAVEIAPGHESDPVEYRWQRAVVSGGGTGVEYVDVAEGEYDGAVFTGATTPSLSVTSGGVPLPRRLYRLRVVQRCDTRFTPGTVMTLDPADMGVQGGIPGSDGVYDNNDFIVFIGYFFDQHLRADVGVTGGEYGSDYVFDNNDFVSFINLFFSGCP